MVTSTARARRVTTTASYGKTPVPTPRELHVMSRLGYGFAPSTFKQVRKAGGAEKWFEQQLEPASVPESKLAKALPGWFPRLQDAPQRIYANNRDDSYPAWIYALDLANYAMLRRAYSNRQLHESMTELWSNHFHVEASGYPAFTHRPSYDATIRKHALGKFEDLLVATTLHPAMVLYLDTWLSTRKSPNENHGRELLELHTVGVGNYTEAMVKDAARILSGHTVDDDTWEPYFSSKRHATGPVSVLGFTHANATADNPGLASDFLRHLARRPETARMVARKLAIRFIADEPSERVIADLAAAYLRSGTDITATMRALVAHPEFWSSAGRKVRTPIDDLIATMRVRRVKPQAPTADDSFANVLVWTLSSVLPFQWSRPDGPPDHGDVWGSTSRMLNSWNMHWSMAGGWWPSKQAKYPKPTAFLPKKKVRFDKLVDHLSRVVLGRPSTVRLLQAACEACDVDPRERVTKDHAVMRWHFPRLLAVLLDSPAHMTR